MLFHSFIVGGLGPNWSWLSRYGWMGVDLFFVLSGFLIGLQVLGPMAAGGQLSLGRFYLRRAFRILPAYWAVLLLYGLWPSFREAPGMEPGWKFFSFVVNLSIDYEKNTAFSHAWSLCVEEHFYGLFPLLAVVMFQRRSAWKFGLFCTAVVAAGIALRTAFWVHGMDADPGFKRNWFVEDLYYPTWSRLDGLLCGVALATWKTMRPQSWSGARQYANWALLGGLMVVGASFWLFQNRVGFLANTIGWPVLSLGLGLLVFAGACPESLLGRREVPLAGVLATISYSVYLMHKAIYHLIQTQWGPQLEGTGLAAFLVYGIAALAAGALLHGVVERPFLRVRMRWTRWGHRQTQRAMAQTPSRDTQSPH